MKIPKKLFCLIVTLIIVIAAILSTQNHLHDEQLMTFKIKASLENA